MKRTGSDYAWYLLTLLMITVFFWAMFAPVGFLVLVIGLIVLLLDVISGGGVI